MSEPADNDLSQRDRILAAEVLERIVERAQPPHGERKTGAYDFPMRGGELLLVADSLRSDHNGDDIDLVVTARDEAESMVSSMALPFELTRGGFTWGTSLDIGEDDLAVMFIVDGEVAPSLWAEQESPALGDLVGGESIGLAPGWLQVRVRHWRAANLLMVGCARLDDGDET